MEKTEMDGWMPNEGRMHEERKVEWKKRTTEIKKWMDECINGYK